MNTEVSLPMASDAPNDDIAGVPQVAVLRDADEAPAVPSVIEPTPDPMAVQTSVSPVFNMDELQAIFTTSKDPHKLFTLSFATPPAVVGKLVKPAKTITKKPPKEKTEAKKNISTLR